MWRDATGAVSASTRDEQGAGTIEEVLRSDLPEQYRVLTARRSDASTSAVLQQSPANSSVGLAPDLREAENDTGCNGRRDAKCGDELILTDENCDADYVLVAGDDGQLHWQQIPRGVRDEVAVPVMRTDAPLACEEALLRQQEKWLSAGIKGVCISGEKEKIDRLAGVVDVGINAMQCPVSSASLPALKSRDKSDAEAVTTALRYQSRVTRPKARQPLNEGCNTDDHSEGSVDNRAASPLLERDEKPAAMLANVSRDFDAASPHAPVPSAPPHPTMVPPINITNYAEKGSHFVEHSILDALKTLVLAQQQSMQVMSTNYFCPLCMTESGQQ